MSAPRQTDPDELKISLAHDLMALRPGTSLRPLCEAKDDVLEVIGEPLVVRIPKFTEEEIPFKDYQALAGHYDVLREYVQVRTPRFALVVDRGFVPPMTDIGPVNYMLVERIEGRPLDEAVREGIASPAIVDSLLAGLASYLLDSARSGRWYVEDICHLDQYVLSTDEEAGQTLWLVDLEPRYNTVADHSLWRMDRFFMEVAELGKAIRYAQRYAAEVPTAITRHTEVLDAICALDPEAGVEMKKTMAELGGDGSWHRSEWLKRGRWSSLRNRT